jgi:hypothetical protein
MRAVGVTVAQLNQPRGITSEAHAFLYDRLDLQVFQQFFEIGREVFGFSQIIARSGRSNRFGQEHVSRCLLSNHLGQLASIRQAA